MIFLISGVQKIFGNSTCLDERNVQTPSLLGWKMGDWPVREEMSSSLLLSGNTVTVTTWIELLEALHDNSWNHRIRRHRSRYLFRGHSRAEYELSPSLSRNGGAQVNLEKHLLRNFVKYAKSHLEASEDQPKNFWHWIALAQHHGLPTRLLDWTYSPLISAHFACSNLESMEHDGAIWMIDYHRAHDHLQTSLKERLVYEGAHVFTDEMLSSVIKSLEHVSDTSGSEQVIFFEPPSISSRIVNQFACFSVQIGACKSMTDWLHTYPDIWRKIIVPAHLKWEVRDKLDQSNITERVLFPGLDGMCRWLARQYFQRNDKTYDEFSEFD